jgi:hypothetical protein
LFLLPQLYSRKPGYGNQNFSEKHLCDAIQLQYDSHKEEAAHITNKDLAFDHSFEVGI